MLLTRRPRTMRTFPGAWVLPGGSVDPTDKSIAAAALRDELTSKAGLVKHFQEGNAALEADLQALEEQQKQMEEQLTAMMNQVCTPEAVDRLARVALVKPEGESGVQPSLMKQPT